MELNVLFPLIAKKISQTVGNPWTFIVMLFLVFIWAISGPILHFSDHWQLIMNTISSVVTFLIAFLIQNTQNRDAEYIKIMLDELIIIHKKASNELLSIDELSDDDLKKLEDKFKKRSPTAKRA